MTGLPVSGLQSTPQGFRTPDGKWNIHASCIAMAGLAVLVSGPAGSGKTSLCADVLTRSDSGHWVADDRLVIGTCGPVIELGAAPPLQGLADLHGEGPVAVDGMTSILVGAPALVWVELCANPTADETGLVVWADHRIRGWRLPMRPDAQRVAALLEQVAGQAGAPVHI